jgi:small nuclear ribonucleoprotein (snRNP)-like protein
MEESVADIYCIFSYLYETTTILNQIIMKKLTCIKILQFTLLAVVCSQSVMAQKSEVEPVSKLQKVTVFTDRAMIMKEALLSVRKGENMVRISGITPNLVDQSVQISLMNQSELSISEVAIEETFLKKTDQPEIQKLQSVLNNLNIQIRECTNQISVINSENDFLRKVNPFGQI